MTWRYVFAREVVDGIECWSVRELYATSEGLSWTGPITPYGETWQELADDLALMIGEAERGHLDLSLPTPAFVRHSAAYPGGHPTEQGSGS